MRYVNFVDVRRLKVNIGFARRTLCVMECLRCFLWCLTDKGRPDALPALRRTPPLGGV